MSHDSLSRVKTGNIMKQLWRACRETADRQTERLTSLKTGSVVKEVCRVCREIAGLETEGLCPDCARIKAQIRFRFPDAVRRTMPTSEECREFGCLCAACSRATIDRHPLYRSDPTRADRRGIHLHPRCRELWLEAGPAPGPAPVSVRRSPQRPQGVYCVRFPSLVPSPGCTTPWDSQGEHLPSVGGSVTPAGMAPDHQATSRDEPDVRHLPPCI